MSLWTRPCVLLAFFALVAAIALFNLITLDPAMGWDGDNALYIAHARNLVQGVAYDATGFIQNPHDMMSPPAYPPGLPVVLAPVYALFGFNIHAFKSSMLVLFMLAVAMTTWYFRDALVATSASPILYPWAFLGLFGFNPFIASFSDRILSDIPFVLCVYLALATLRRTYRARAASAPCLAWALCAGACIYLAIATRIIGVVLIPTVVIYELWHYHRMTRVGLVALALSLLLWAAQRGILALDAITPTGSQAGYARMMTGDLTSRLAHLPSAMLDSARHYAWGLFGIWSSARVEGWLAICVLGITAIALYGFLRQLKKRVGLSEIFLVVYGLALLPWSSHYTRYLLPLLPLYFFYLLIGLAALARGLPAYRALRYAPVVIVGVISAALYARSYAAMIGIRPPLDAAAPNAPAAMATYRYIRKNTPADAVFIFRKPRILALFTDRRVSTFAHSARITPPLDARLLRYIQRIHASYVLDGPPDRDHRMAVLARRNPRYFELVYGNDAFVLYRYVPVKQTD